MKKLAIVIPAYKIDYFQGVLESLSKQTNKDFNVYVGIDASESNFESVIEQYQSSINIFHKRFDNNLGTKDLVAQWNRCLNLIKNEEWIWLFSDDDMMTEDCVEMFYKEIEKDEKFDIYHFDVKVIDNNNKIVRIPTPYPQIISSLSLYKRKNTASIESFVVENIFSRNIYNSIGGFKKFDLAWGTDLATWVMMASYKGMKTIKGANVLWRESETNITPNLDVKMVVRKLEADITFFSWANKYFSNIYLFNKYILFRLLFHYSRKISYNVLNQILCNAKSHKIINHIDCIILSISYPIIRIVKQIKDFING